MHFASGGRLALRHRVALWKASPIRFRRVALLLLTPLPVCTAQSSTPSDPRYVRAVRSLCATSLRAGLVKAWCDALAAEARLATDASLPAYKAKYPLGVIDARAVSELSSELPAPLGERERVDQRLEHRESVVCGGLPTAAGLSRSIGESAAPASVRDRGGLQTRSRGRRRRAARRRHCAAVGGIAGRPTDAAVRRAVRHAIGGAAGSHGRTEHRTWHGVHRCAAQRADPP